MRQNREFAINFSLSGPRPGLLEGASSIDWRMKMLKNVLCAAVAAGFVAATFIPVQAASVAPGMSCKEASKMMYPDSRKMRHHFKKSCKHNFKHANKS